MKLYLMQHGNPVPKGEDPERPLSDQGVEDVKKISGFLKHSGTQISQVLHSGKKRALQTAETVISIVCPGLTPVDEKGLSPMDEPGRFADLVGKFEKDTLVVGHLPHLSKLVSLLLKNEESVPVVNFQQGGIVCLSITEGQLWTIDWMIVPAVMGQ